MELESQPWEVERDSKGVQIPERKRDSRGEGRFWRAGEGLSDLGEPVPRRTPWPPLWPPGCDRCAGRHAPPNLSLRRPNSRPNCGNRPDFGLDFGRSDGGGLRLDTLGPCLARRRAGGGQSRTRECPRHSRRPERSPGIGQAGQRNGAMAGAGGRGRERFNRSALSTPHAIHEPRPTDNARTQARSHRCARRQTGSTERQDGSGQRQTDRP